MSTDSTFEPDDRIEVERDLYWALVPEWVIYSDVSANAIRLYCVLARHADKDTKKCHPTRATLASLMRASRATVDRATTELQSIGAIQVRQRKSQKGDWTSNVYVVKAIPPVGVSSRVMRPLLTGEDTGLLTGDEQTIVSVNQSQEPGARKISSDVKPGDSVAKQWWESLDTKPIGKRAWFALRSVCQAAAQRGYTDEQIYGALERIGTVPSLAQIDRELRRPNAGRETNRERQLREGVERAQRLAEQEQASVIELFNAPKKELNA